MAKTKAQLEREIRAVAGDGGDGGVSRAREISDRRIAALIALGEDVRNTSAWRDAMYERQMIDRGDTMAREISDRRIAALIALGEDVRNTPSWRDAMHERQTIERASGERSAKPAVGRSGRPGQARVTAKNLTDLQIHQVWSTTTDPEISDACRDALGIGSPTWMIRQAARAAVAAEYNARKAAGLTLRTTHVASGR